jgi:hypothetical protein
MKTKFQVGDRVKWCGAELNIVDTEGSFVVLLHEASGNRFTIPNTGILYSFHTEPCLTLVERAKQKREVRLYAYLQETTAASKGRGVRQLSWYDADDLLCRKRVPSEDKIITVEE